MATTSSKTKIEGAEVTRIVVAILLGIGCFAAVIAGGSTVGGSLSGLVQSLEVTSPEKINPMR
tara:strand:- start:413 stop:601 length:189 start_codon:yes stop_codon:yes gene_type:complete